MKKLHTFLILTVLLTSSVIFPQDVAVYISDAGNFNNGPWQIAKFNEAGNLMGQLLKTEDGIFWPQDIVFLDSEETVLISNLGPAGNISKHNWANGNFIENFAEGLGGPTRMKIGPDGLLYVLQWSITNNKVLRFNLDGTFVDEFTEVGVAQSIGIDWDANGDLYVSSYNGSSVRKFDGTTGDDLGLFIPSGLQGPTNIFFEGNGNLIVLSYNGGKIKRYDSTGAFVEDLVSGLSGPEGYAFFANGDILIGNGGDGSVKRYDSNYVFIENFVEPGILNTPNAIVIREDIPLSVTEKKINNIFLTPTMGHRFLLNNAIVIEYNVLEVYNNFGQLVETLIPKDTTFWDAAAYAEGMYFVIGKRNGQQHAQKIIVKKD